MTTPTAVPPASLPPEAFDTTLPEMFADRFFIVSDQALARVAYGCALPSGAIRYDAGIRMPTRMMPEMVRVMTNLCNQLGLPIPLDDVPPVKKG